MSLWFFGMLRNKQTSHSLGDKIAVFKTYWTSVFNTKRMSGPSTVTHSHINSSLEADRTISWTEKIPLFIRTWSFSETKTTTANGSFQQLMKAMKGKSEKRLQENGESVLRALLCCCLRKLKIIKGVRRRNSLGFPYGRSRNYHRQSS